MSKLPTCDQFESMIDYWLTAAKSEPGLVLEIYNHMTTCPVCLANRQAIAEWRERRADDEIEMQGG